MLTSYSSPLSERKLAGQTDRPNFANTIERSSTKEQAKESQISRFKKKSTENTLVPLRVFSRNNETLDSKRSESLQVGRGTAAHEAHREHSGLSNNDDSNG